MNVVNVQLLICSIVLSETKDVYNAHSVYRICIVHIIAASIVCILRLLCGRLFDQLDWSSGDLIAIIEAMKEQVYSMMNGTVESRLEKWYSDTTLEYNVIGKWISKGPLDVSKATSAQQSYLKNTVQRLQQLLFLSSSRTCLSSGAIFKRGYGSNSYYPHERVEAGDMVQELIAKHDPSAQFITVSAEGVGSQLFFVVGGLISVTSGSIWLVVKRCTTGPSHAPQVPDYNESLKIHVTVPPFYEPNSVFQFLELSKHVRKI